MTCWTVWTAAVRPVARTAVRRTLRHVARHKLLHAALVATTVCTGAPIALYHLLPPSIAQPRDQTAVLPLPVQIPASGALAVLPGLLAMLALRRGR